MADVAVEFGRAQFLKATSSTGDHKPEDFAILSTNVESIVPGTSATSLGKAEDAVAASGDTGVAVLAVRRDTASAGGADGDYVNVSTDQNGGLRTQAGGYQAVVEATVGGSTAVAAAGDYAANDILSNSTSAGVGWLFTGLARVSGGSGVAYRSVITGSVAGLVPRLRLWLFNANPSASTLNDNAAFSLHASDRSKVMGYIDFPAMVNAGGVSYAQNITDRIGYKAVGSADVYAIVQTLDAFTNETAGMTLTINLQVVQD